MAHQSKKHEDTRRPYYQIRNPRPNSVEVNQYNHYNVVVNHPVQKPHPGVYIQNRHLKREARELREENEEKERQIEEYYDEIEQKERENERLKRRVELEKNQKAAEEARFQREVKQKKDMIQELAKEKNMLNSENKNIKNEFNAVEKANEYLKEELNAKERQLEQEKREKELSSMTVGRLSKMIMEYESEAYRFKRRVDNEILRRDQEILDKKSEVRYLKKEVDELNTLVMKIQNRTDDEWRVEVERLQVKLMDEIKNGREMSEEVVMLKQEIERLKLEKNVSEVKKVEEERVPLSKLCSDLKIENENLKNQNTIYLYLLIIIASIVSAWLLLKLV